MRKFLLALSLLFTSSQVVAANNPPGFEPARWQALVEKVAFVGVTMNAGDWVFRSFSRLNPDNKEVSHQADYFSTVGAFDTLGKYHASFVSAVSESWTRDEQGGWKIDQWIWNISLSGELRSVSHAILLETATGSVLSHESQPTGGAGDAAELARWGSKLNEWYRFDPGALR